jgi:hypothetical protein
MPSIVADRFNFLLLTNNLDTKYIITYILDTCYVFCRTVCLLLYQRYDDTHCFFWKAHDL